MTTSVSPIEVGEAVLADVPEVLRMAGEFLAITSYAKTFSLTPDDVAKLLAELAARDDGVILVARASGHAVGLLAGRMAPLWLDPSRAVAAELVWWVDRDARGTHAAAQLVEAFEQWAAGRGAAHVVMSNVELDGEEPSRVPVLLRRLGYRLAEQSHLKEI